MVSLVGTKQKIGEGINKSQHKVVMRCIQDAFFAHVCSMQESEMLDTNGKPRGNQYDEEESLGRCQAHFVF